MWDGYDYIAQPIGWAEVELSNVGYDGRIGQRHVFETKNGSLKTFGLAKTCHTNSVIIWIYTL